MSLKNKETLFSIKASKTIGRYREFGCSMFGAVKFGQDPVYFEFSDGEKIEISGIYQCRKSSKGSVFVRERFYFPSNPKTESQLLTRSNLSNAVSSWQDLTEEAKNFYNNKARGFNMSGYNLYIREYIKSL